MPRKQSNKLSKNLESPFSAPPVIQTCTLLSQLPLEIRTAIFRLALPEPSTLKPAVSRLFEIAQAHDRFKPARRFRKYERVLGLARACKQTYTEVIPIYFGENTFRFSGAYDLYRYLYMIGHWRRRWIRSIQFLLSGEFKNTIWSMPNRDVYPLAFDMLADCESLRSLHIGMTNDTFERPVKYDPTGLTDTGLVEVIFKLPSLTEIKLRGAMYWDDNCFQLFRQDIMCPQMPGPNFLAGFEPKSVQEVEVMLQRGINKSKSSDGDKITDADKVSQSLPAKKSIYRVKKSRR
ncbi:hypothetical protein F5884DRAFT_857123 [Xylogone sp. PMI_703]|nr:hypothetical protein F5884DRAFT_857123 [Xylogone sp. PMI_703]